MDDRNAVRVALELAVEYETTFVESYSKNSKDDAVLRALRRIDDFKRVLRKRYGIEIEDRFKGYKTISIYDIASK